MSAYRSQRTDAHNDGTVPNHGIEGHSANAIDVHVDEDMIVGLIVNDGGRHRRKVSVLAKES